MESIKYHNVSSVIRIGYILFHMSSIFVIIFEWLSIDDLVNCIFITFILLLCMAMYNFLFFGFKDLWYNTYIFDDKIKQKYLKWEKQILFKDVNYLFFIDNLLILSKVNKKDYSSGEYSFNEKKIIKKEIKNNITIWINTSNKYLANILNEKCLNAQIIKIGKISKYIEQCFNI